MKVFELKKLNPKEVDVSELPEKNIVGKLHIEEALQHPGDLVSLNTKSYITVEKVNHYYFDGVQYQFAKTILYVKPLEVFI